ncbi:MAG: GlsB/YeaQ/YmgE family stress response membrane protein [Bacteroidota bacterium]|nr:GlsB/YeaQ/YmgE family stress response membrane protein [Bacteroidota bacterium]MDP4190342.1 GlsB/YeaQ/YmgE family stress response membrane protein [Bacteroidota bacterium]MDP4193530.1 GlsB/YeaQ/YmgE family stress response membrane protein [Bacteroidota bacterium]
MIILWSIIIGGIAGAIAKLLMPGKDPGGFIITIALGIVGAILATFLGRAVGWYHEGQSAGLIGAVVGAVIILAIYRFIVGRRPLT